MSDDQRRAAGGGSADAAARGAAHVVELLVRHRTSRALGTVKLVVAADGPVDVAFWREAVCRAASGAYAVEHVRDYEAGPSSAAGVNLN